MILGLGDRSILSPELRFYLHTHSITTLAHARVLTGASPLPDAWLTSSDLTLRELIATEWTHFTTALKSAGISLTVELDTLVWAGGDTSGAILVKNLYAALQFQHIADVDKPWIKQLWNCNVPLKLKLFFWLAGNDRILT